MLYIVFALWILVWGLAGYFTVRAIRVRKETKRREEYMAVRAMNYAYCKSGYPEKIIDAVVIEKE